jgi:hypothetical protein
LNISVGFKLKFFLLLSLLSVEVHEGKAKEIMKINCLLHFLELNNFLHKQIVNSNFILFISSNQILLNLMECLIFKDLLLNFFNLIKIKTFLVMVYLKAQIFCGFEHFTIVSQFLDELGFLFEDEAYFLDT